MAYGGSWACFPGKTLNGEILHGTFLPICDVDANYPGIPDSQTWVTYYDSNDPGVPVPIRFNNICHDTNGPNAFTITQQNSIKAGPDGFSWWSIATPEHTYLSVQQRYHGKFDNHEKVRHFGTSAAFNFDKPSQFGNHRFTYSFNELLQAYADSVCPGNTPVVCKVYGTVKFKAQVMYAVVVCPENCFKDYPLISGPQGRMKLIQDGESWIWNAASTSSEYVRNGDHIRNVQYRCWELVSIAFYLPGGRFMQIPHAAAHHQKYDF